MSVLFKECIDALHDDVMILSDEESKKIFSIFENEIPIISGGSKIDWQKINNKIDIGSPQQIVILLEEIKRKKIDTNVYILWNNAALPVIKSNLDLIQEHFDDVVCVGFETWFFNINERYVIEFSHTDKMVGGFY